MFSKGFSKRTLFNAGVLQAFLIISRKTRQFFSHGKESWKKLKWFLKIKEKQIGKEEGGTIGEDFFRSPEAHRSLL